MNKRKIQINEIKKTVLREAKFKTITTRYEIALSYFKQKDKSSNIFSICFQPLILDLIAHLANAELLYKLENKLIDELHDVEIVQDSIRVDELCLKFVAKEYPIRELIECISIKKDSLLKKITLEILKNKLMVFFKHLRSIYPEFCFCVGEKIILESYDVKKVYEAFKCEWAKLYERGRMGDLEKCQKLLCRCLYFIGVLIENNIFLEEHEKKERKKQEATADETKSEKKKNVKGITYPVSSTYSYGSNDMLSTFSYGLKSRKSNDEDFSKNVFSEKSEKVKPKDRCRLWEKMGIKSQSLKISLGCQKQTAVSDHRVEIDLLSNDVENILIEHAFKIQKLKDACERNKFEVGFPYAYQHYYSNASSDFDPYNQMRRNFNFSNLVEVRKPQSRHGENKYS